MHRLTFIQSISLLALLVISACSPGEAVDFGELPLYPDTKPLQDKDVLAETLAESLRQSTGLQDMEVDMIVVNLTGDNNWDRIRSFYATAMEERGWAVEENYANDSDYVHVAAWKHGAWSPDQVLLVSRTIDPLGGAPYLILILFTR